MRYTYRVRRIRRHGGRSPKNRAFDSRPGRLPSTSHAFAHVNISRSGGKARPPALRDVLDIGGGGPSARQRCAVPVFDVSPGPRWTPCHAQ